MNLSQFLIILRARRKTVFVTFFSIVALVTVLSLLWPNKYTSTASVLVDVKTGDQLTGLVAPAAMMPSYMATQVDVITSRTVAARVVEKLHLADNPLVKQQFMDDTEGRGDIRYWLADILLRKLDVKPSRDSNVVDISFSNENAQFATLVVNAFVDAYIETNLELRVAPAKQTSDWFEQQLKGLRTSLDASQRKLSAYQQDKGIVAVDERLDVENAKLAELSSLVINAQGQKLDTESRQRQLAQSGPTSAIPDILNNPLIQNLKADLSRSEAQLAELTEKLDRNHPSVKNATAQVESIRRKLDAEIKTASSSIVNTAQMQQRREGDLRVAMAAQKAKILELNKQRDEMALLTREVENAQRAYDAALQRASQTKLESQSNQTNIVLLTRGIEPSLPSSPKVLLNIFLSIILGLFLGVNAAVVREMLDRRVRGPEDLAMALGVPVLAILPGAEKSTKRFWRRNWRGKRDIPDTLLGAR
ncbi:chain length determinant protein EpsF [Chitinivorax sp. PXF-14]|uniref:chain length determinant protein EpsF n=1 Tax=Chitinivorax sp. PXF-14 TaxID=3230488 RepID=UPI003466C18C